jgi:hypothetical protein
MKEILAQQLLDGDMQNYLRAKENWTRQVFDNSNWRSYSMAFKRLPRSRKTAGAKACHNLWHTWGKRKQYYGSQKPFCMCGDAHEDWRHIITCKSLDASLHRTKSWTKVNKAMKAWRISPDFWIAI